MNINSFFEPATEAKVSRSAGKAAPGKPCGHPGITLARIGALKPRHALVCASCGLEFPAARDEDIDKLYEPEIVKVPVAVAPATAITRFGADAGVALKADALAVQARPVTPPQTDEQASWLADNRAKVKLLLKDIEERRVLVVKPLKAEAAAVDAEANRWKEPLIQWDQQAERALLAWNRQREAKRLAAEREVQARALAAAQAQAEAAKAGDVVAEQQAELAVIAAEADMPRGPVTGFKTDAGTQSLVELFEVEVVDLEQLPPAYLMADMPKLRAAVKAGARDIPGCHIGPREQLRVRTR